VVAKNEYESFQIVTRSSASYTITGVTFSDLTSGRECDRSTQPLVQLRRVRDRTPYDPNQHGNAIQLTKPRQTELLAA
jgi:hypothetical protein